MSSTGNTNPGNFANRPKDEVSEIAKKGGEASHQGGFASMDPDKQVQFSPIFFQPSAGSTLTTGIEGNCIHGWSGLEWIIREGE